MPRNKFGGGGGGGMAVVTGVVVAVFVVAMVEVGGVVEVTGVLPSNPGNEEDNQDLQANKIPFEAVFQGLCEESVLCAQTCFNLHDGTFECNCRPGHALDANGYSCSKMNDTSADGSILYEKEASFVAVLDESPEYQGDQPPIYGPPLEQDKYHLDYAHDYPGLYVPRPEDKYSSNVQESFYAVQSEDYDEPQDGHYGPDGHNGLDGLDGNYGHDSYDGVDVIDGQDDHGDNYSHDNHVDDDVRDTFDAGYKSRVIQVFEEPRVLPSSENSKSKNYKFLKPKGKTQLIDEQDLIDYESRYKRIRPKQVFNDDINKEDEGPETFIEFEQDLQDRESDQSKVRGTNYSYGLPSTNGSNKTTASNGSAVIHSGASDGGPSKATSFTSPGPNLEQKVPSAQPELQATESLQPQCALDCGPGRCYSAGVQATVENNGVRCKCPLGYQGTYCRQAPRITTARFHGRSWVGFAPLRQAYKDVQISLEFKPEIKDDQMTVIFNPSSSYDSQMHKQHKQTVKRRKKRSEYETRSSKKVFKTDDRIFNTNDLIYSTNDVLFNNDDYSEGTSAPQKIEKFHGGVAQVERDLFLQNHDQFSRKQYNGRDSAQNNENGFLYKNSYGDFTEQNNEKDFLRTNNGKNFNQQSAQQQNGRDFIKHDDEKDFTIQKNNISLNAVLLVSGENDDLAGDFMAAVIVDGVVEFRWDCGSGAGVVRAPEPVRMNQWNRLSVSRSRWNVWLQFNEGKHVQGRSEGLFSRITFREPLYVGGSFNLTSLHGRLGVSQGLTGCIRNLQVNDHLYKFYKATTATNLASDYGALDGWDISECVGDACSEMWCQNGGTCVSSPPPPTTVPPTPPAVFTPTQPEAACYCALGYTGPLCEARLNLEVPSFNGTSHLVFPGLSSSVMSWLELELVFRSSSMDGLLLYEGSKSDISGDYLALTLSNAHVVFTIDLGSGSLTLRSLKPLRSGLWHKVYISRTGRRVWLYINNQPPVEGLTPGGFTMLSLSQQLHMGGVPQGSAAKFVLPDTPNFEGCIQRFAIGGEPVSLVSAAISGHNVGSCNHPCSQKPCSNGGVCEPRGASYSCRCPIGFSDDHCRSRLITQASTPSFGGRSFLKFTHPGIMKRVTGDKLHVRFRFRSTSRNGLLLWIGKEKLESSNDQKNDESFRFLSLGDCLSLEIQDGDVVLRYNLGSGFAVLKYNSSDTYDDGEWHSVRLARFERQAQLTIDDGPELIAVSPGTLVQLNVDSALYIGGRETYHTSHSSPVIPGLQGCVSGLTLATDYRVDLITMATAGQNIEYC